MCQHELVIPQKHFIFEYLFGLVTTTFYEFIWFVCKNFNGQIFTFPNYFNDKKVNSQGEMTSFLEIFQQRNSIADHYFDLIAKAQDRREIEYQSAIKIQCAFRRFVFRQKLAERNQKAIIIQRTYRMNRAKELMKCLKVQKACEARMLYFNQMATKIQKVWRQFVIRNNIQIPVRKEGDPPPPPKKFPKIRRVIKLKKKIADPAPATTRNALQRGMTANAEFNGFHFNHNFGNVFANQNNIIGQVRAADW
ncbi:hypothetical protein TRFO_23793 [Tritrichomonas foetus]|uniref:IQ calmodulin-binding motif family protein n=1 Tax=Tritrichomonas foetus TaxID=1144522 RepID=A0A1J4KAB0_9EUKA|nr:hypothetical protein TRFO_23793 [Tritrichomonas foetus]|eukprot:OHT07848.1 hypothetical protein TRFO_23793 [Tritrichomonas foetus]